MNSGYKVVWTEEANRNVDAIIEYLETNWSEREILHFLIRIQERVWLISQRPELFPVSGLIKNAHRSVLSKQHTIYYRVTGHKIEILNIFDTRQNPDKLE